MFPRTSAITSLQGYPSCVWLYTIKLLPLFLLFVLSQVIDSETFRPFSVHKHPAPILSLAASPAGDVVAAGMADGTLSVHRWKPQATAAAEPTRLRLGELYVECLWLRQVFQASLGCSILTPTSCFAGGSRSARQVHVHSMRHPSAPSLARRKWMQQSQRSQRYGWVVSQLRL